MVIVNKNGQVCCFGLGRAQRGWQALIPQSSWVQKRKPSRWLPQPSHWLCIAPVSPMKEKRRERGRRKGTLHGIGLAFLLIPLEQVVPIGYFNSLNSLSLVSTSSSFWTLVWKIRHSESSLLTIHDKLKNILPCLLDHQRNIKTRRNTV